VINLDNLIVGDKLYFNSGQSTPGSVRKLTRDRALAIARSQGVYATSNPGGNPDYPRGTGCCNDGEVFDKAGIPAVRGSDELGAGQKRWLSAASQIESLPGRNKLA
jgi:alkaline phosphatase isozyme conversion protein